MAAEEGSVQREGGDTSAVLRKQRRLGHDGMTTGHDDGNGRHDNEALQLGRAARQQQREAHDGDGRHGDGRHGDAARQRQGAAGQQAARQLRQAVRRRQGAAGRQTSRQRQRAGLMT